MDTTQETLSQVSDATLEQPITITVDINPQNIVHARLQHWGLLPKKRVFLLRPIYLGTLIRISRLLLSINFGLPEVKREMDKGSFLDMNYHAIDKHADKMAFIVAAAIQNNRKQVDKKLVQFILRNFTAKELLGVLGIVVKQMNLTAFTTSIISIRGLNVLDNRTANAPSVNGNEVSL